MKIATFATEDEAYTHMVHLNRAQPHAEPVVLIDGPDNNYAVVDLNTAIEMNAYYQWEA